MASSDITNVVNFFSTAAEGFNTTLSSTITAAATSVPLTSTAGLTNGTVFVGIIEPGQTAQQTLTGTVDVSGSQITNVKWVRGANVGHAGGVTIVDYVSGASHNMMTAGILKQHTQTGTHTGLTTDTIATSGNATVGGTLGVTGVLTPSGGLAAGTVNFAALLSTIFSGQVNTQVNAGTAGGTMRYVNLGGIKLLWLLTPSLTQAPGSTTYGVTFPAGFFTTVTFGTESITVASGSIGLNDIIGISLDATQLTFTLTNSTGSSGVGGIVGILVIGT